MSVVPIPEMKSRIEDGPEGLCFNIPARRHILAVIILPVWLAGWCLSEVFVVLQIAFGENRQPLLILWAAAWTVGGAFAAFTLMWNLAGRERVLLEPGAVVHRYEVFGIGRSREYNLAQMRNLRVSPVPTTGWFTGVNERNWGPGGGMIAFDYGARTIRFGASLDEAEANMIVSRMKERHGL